MSSSLSSSSSSLTAHTTHTLTSVSRHHSDNVFSSPPHHHDELYQLVHKAEQLLLQAHYADALSMCRPLIPSLNTINSLSSSSSPSFIDAHHYDMNTMVLMRAVAVAIQALVELHHIGHVDILLRSCYGDNGLVNGNMPHSIVMLWLNALEWTGDITRVCHLSSQYLNMRGHHLPVDERDECMCLLIINGLCSQKRWCDAHRVLDADEFCSDSCKNELYTKMKNYENEQKSEKNINELAMTTSIDKPVLSSSLSSSSSSSSDSSKGLSSSSSSSSSSARNTVSSSTVHKACTDYRLMMVMMMMKYCLRILLFCSGGIVSTWFTLYILRRLTRQPHLSLLILWRRFCRVIIGSNIQ